MKLKHFYLDDEPGAAGGGDSAPADTSSWTDGIDESLRDGVSKFGSVNDLAKSYTELERSMGSRVRIPSEDASDEQRNEFYEKLTKIDGVVRVPGVDDEKGWEQFYNSLGRPESADEYKVPELENMPENMQRDEELEGWFKGIAHKIGLNQEQFNGIIGAWNESVAEVAAAQLDEKGEVTNKLKGEWGGDYDRRIGVVSAVLKEFGNEALDAELAQTGYGNSPELTKFLYDLGAKTLEDSVLQGGGTPEPTTMELEDKASELRAHPAYLDPNHVQHKSVVDKVFEIETKLARQAEQRMANMFNDNDGGITV